MIDPRILAAIQYRCPLLYEWAQHRDGVIELDALLEVAREQWDEERYEADRKAEERAIALAEVPG